MKLISWNVNGLRACLTHDFAASFAALDADVFSVQETKMQPGQADFAPEGYTVNAFRYILKRDLDCQLPRCLDAILHEQDHRAPKTLTIRQNRTEMELPYDSIYCLESDLRKVNVYGDVPHQPLCSYYGKLTDLPAELFENGFLRVGRSDVVNMRYIRQISGYKVTLRNGVELSVSRNGYAAIRATYLEWKGQYVDE